ncbi:hypothetical protein AB1K62_02900 [Parasphingorhabdus sp. JC815]|uniref:hypothetical protein n=1 Tax=Parasphingorhabdus sp. JC815 TaxID=3232140 RepID=UPI00345A45E3
MTQNNDDIFRLRSLAIEKKLARDNVRKELSDTKERLRPANLIQEAKDKTLDRIQKVSEDALQGVKDHPGKVATVATAAALMALRKPLTKHYSKRKAYANSEHHDAED